MNFIQPSVLDIEDENEDNDDALPDLDITHDDSITSAALLHTGLEDELSSRSLALISLSFIQRSPSEPPLNVNQTILDLKYFAERGCIVPLLHALHTPRLKSRMLHAFRIRQNAPTPHSRCSKQAYPWVFTAFHVES